LSLRRARPVRRLEATHRNIGGVGAEYNAVVTHTDDDSSASVRAAARESWTVRKHRLGDEPSDDLSDSTTAEERIAMMEPLALEAWALTGKPLPDYDRGSAPVRRFRRMAS
jgi:hypothetical protein